MKVDNVTFGARYVKSAEILKKEQNKLIKYKLAMVELNPFEIKDIRCINDLNIDWGGRSSLSHNFFNNMYNIFADYTSQCTSRFFALTQQKGDFMNLEPEKILSISQTSEIDERMVNLDLIETFSEESHTSKDAKFKHIGQAMLDNIKFLNLGRDILLETHEKNESFYTKNGFEKIEGGINRYIFKNVKYF